MMTLQVPDALFTDFSAGYKGHNLAEQHSSRLRQGAAARQHRAAGTQAQVLPEAGTGAALAANTLEPAVGRERRPARAAHMQVASVGGCRQAHPSA